MQDTTDRIMREGKPFHLKFNTTSGSTSAETFTLDSSTYNGTAGYFADKTLWVSHIKVTVAGTGTAYCEYLKFDSDWVWDDTTVGADLDIVTDDYFGQKFLPIRYTTAVKNGAADDVITVELYGLYTKRNM